MPVRVDPNWTYNGLRCIRLENEALELNILPERGANIFRLIDKVADKDLLWKSPRVTPHIAPLHSNFDDHWAGGWDDAFPGGRACRDRYGDLLPYMGEIWTQQASFAIESAGPGEASVTTSVMTPITPARLTKTISLRAGQPTFTLKYVLENVGRMPFDYNWGIHPCLALEPSMRFDIPATHGLVDEAGGHVLGETGRRYEWPFLDGLDLRQAKSPDLGAFALHYLTGLTAGWFAATDASTKRGFGLCFDKDQFPVIWYCMVYGGWRGYYQALVEPWTGFPSPLDEAVAGGHARILNPGEKVCTTVTAVIYGGVQSVSELHPDGSVVPA